MRGVFILRREILAGIPAGEHYEIGKDLLPSLIAEGKAFYGYVSRDYSKGIDTLDKWKEVEAYLRESGFSAGGVNVEKSSGK
jgi:NDP-sugar pyrophosphorylase family protein